MAELQKEVCSRRFHLLRLFPSLVLGQQGFGVCYVLGPLCLSSREGEDSSCLKELQTPWEASRAVPALPTTLSALNLSYA